MKKKKHIVIPHEQIASRLPILHGVILWLLLDRLEAHSVLQGVIWTMYAFVIAGALAVKAYETERPLPGYGEQLAEEESDDQ